MMCDTWVYIVAHTIPTENQVAKRLFPVDSCVLTFMDNKYYIGDFNGNATEVTVLGVYPINEALRKITEKNS